jgi:hypothetical protein
MKKLRVARSRKARERCPASFLLLRDLNILQHNQDNNEEAEGGTLS